MKKIRVPNGVFSKTKQAKGEAGANAEQKLKTLSSIPGKVLGGLLAAFVLLSLLIGTHFTLNEDQQAVVTTFGKPVVVTKAGWNWKIPYVQKVTIMTKSVMGMPIGWDPETNCTVSEESIMITSDFNFVDVDFYIDYRISDPVQFMKNRDTAELILKNLAQSYIRDTIGTFTVDSTITTGKVEIESRIEESLRERIDDENIGLHIENVLMQDAEMPTREVQAAFKAVEDASQSMSERENEARKYENEQIPAAEAKADGIVKKAEADKQARIAEATGLVAKFNSMYAEYSKFPMITKSRMFYETMSDVLPDLKVIINTADGTQTVLPLDKFN